MCIESGSCESLPELSGVVRIYLNHSNINANY